MRRILSTLRKILKRASISTMLRQAVEETILALQKKDLELAYQITTCKSLICSDLRFDAIQNAFREDDKANEKALGDSVYSLMDGIHHELAHRLHKMPSGMMVLSHGPQGVVVEEMKPSGTHPVVKRIIFERNRLKRRYKDPFRK